MTKNKPDNDELPGERDRDNQDYFENLGVDREKAFWLWMVTKIEKMVMDSYGNSYIRSDDSSRKATNRQRCCEV